MSFRHLRSFGPFAVALFVALSFSTMAQADEPESPPADPAPSSPRSALGSGAVVFPDIVGISTLPLFGAVAPAGAGAVGGLGGASGVALSGPISFGSSSGEGGTKSGYLGVSPSIDVFVTERLTIGGRVTAGRYTASSVMRSTIPGTTQTTALSTGSEGYVLAVAPRVGYLVPLTESLAFWPQVGVMYGQSRSESDRAWRTLSRSVGVEVEAGLVMPIGRHVVVRVAPTLAYGFVWTDSTALLPSEDTESVRAGVRAQVGLVF